MNNGFIATLWMQLTDIYGMRFINLYGDKDSGVWFQALRDLTDKEIEMGLHAMFRDERFETWPPNCTQFRHLCLKTNELPIVHKAFKEARHNLNSSKPSWSHPAVKFTVKHLGLDVVNADRADRAFEKFNALYTQLSEQMRHGFEVPHISDDELVIKKTITQNKIPKLIHFIK